MAFKKFKKSSIASGYKRSLSLDIDGYAFPKTPELLSWFDASDLNTFKLNGNSVVEWMDKGNYRSNMYQTTATAQPTLVSNGLNGKSIVTFDGTDDFLLNTYSTVAYDRPITTFVVSRPNVVPTSHVVLSGSGQGPAGASDAHFYFIETGDHSYWTGAKSIHATTTRPSNGVWHLINTAMSSAGIVSMRVNQTSQALTYGAAAYDGLDAAPLATEGRRFNNPTAGKHPASGNGSYFQGSIAEILVYNKQMTTQEIVDIENYLKSKWGV